MGDSESCAFRIVPQQKGIGEPFECDRISDSAEKNRAGSVSAQFRPVAYALGSESGPSLTLWVLNLAELEASAPSSGPSLMLWVLNLAEREASTRSSGPSLTLWVLNYLAERAVSARSSGPSLTLWALNYLADCATSENGKSMNTFQKLYLWACERLYAELAWSYDWVSWLVSWGAWDQWRVTALNYIRGERILEIGFGTGSLLAKLADTNYQVTGLEFSAAMQREAANKLARHGLAVPRVQAPAQAMPFATGSFDTIIATFPSGYIVDPATLCECARLLQPIAAAAVPGRLIIVMGASAPNSPLALAMKLLFPRQSTITPIDDPLLARFRTAGLQASYVNANVGNQVVHLIIAEPIAS